MEEFRKKRKLELEKNFVKKYKFTSEIITRYSNEKKNEINYQHHDHSFAKNIIIDHLNDDCLAEIFMYVPACERLKIALVCQKWKRALDYSWSNVKKLELTYWKYYKKPTCLKKYPTLDGQLNFFKSLLSKCGHYITQLDLTAYRHCNIVPVVNEYCPNLVELRLRFFYIDHVVLNNAFSRLCKLKVLAIIFQDFKDKFIPLNLIYSLRNVADTLTDLVLLNWTKKVRVPCEFSEKTICVIRELKALKRVDISGIIRTQDLEKYLHDKMSVYAIHDVYLSLVETIQLRNIKQLVLYGLLITDDGVYTIANNLKRLKVFILDWSDITNVGMLTISKMNLMSLGLNGSNDVIDSSSINLLKNLKIVSFTLSNNITDDLAMKVLKNSPKLERFYFLETSVTVEFIKKAREISSNRKIPLCIGVSFECDKKKYESAYLTIERI